jgi:hypothetical protein
VGCSAYATALWNYWKENHHRPVLAQLPVVIIHANVITCGDYFTLHTDPETGEQTLHLWELKTGWPKDPLDEREVMMPPLAYVKLTPRNRWQVQLMLTRMAYEKVCCFQTLPNSLTLAHKELKMKIDAAHVVNVYAKRVLEEGADAYSYRHVVDVIGIDRLEPAGWPELANLDVMYEALKAPAK